MTEQEFGKLFQAKLLTTFKNTVDFLNKNNIRWWVCGGTAIGVIRHKGFIPWDDDIDIFVLREDYEKLFCLRSQLPAYGLNMKSIEDGCGYYNGFIKIYDNNTTLWEHREYPEIVGIYIDVFPIEKTDADKYTMLSCMAEYRSAMAEYRESISVVTIPYLRDLLKGLHLKTVWNSFCNSIRHHDKKGAYERFLKSTRQVENSADGKNMMCIMGSYKDREFLDARLFDNTLKMPFENITVNVPAGYDEYLTQLYKDYMKLPPVEQRISHHDHYYCNFSEGLSMDQVKQRIKQGKFIEL